MHACEDGDISSAERLQMMAHRCTVKGAHCEIFAVDVKNHERLTSIIESVDDKWSIDLVIANAGVGGALADDERWEDGWKEVLDVNLLGVMNTVMPIYKRMKERSYGQIAITSSVVGFFGPPKMCWYNSSKTALLAFVRDFRIIAGRQGVLVNVITPGLTNSRLAVGVFPLPAWMMASPEKLAHAVKQGLERNVPLIAWPAWQMVALNVVHSMPPSVLEWASWISSFVF